MLCTGCGERMQRETVVLVTRSRGRSKSVMQPGWYCWTCKTSAHSASDLLAADEPRRTPRYTSFASGNWFASAARTERRAAAS